VLRRLIFVILFDTTKLIVVVVIIQDPDEIEEAEEWVEDSK